jgi:hypothetical protein
MKLKAAISVTIALCGCASVPPESVQLSEAIGRDMTSIEVAHREIATRYFSAMREEVNRFIAREYRPFTIRKTIEELDLATRLQDALEPGAELDPIDLMTILVEEVQADIDNYRSELLGPIVARERMVLASLDTAYSKLRNANHALTAHLVSVRKVHEAQSSALRGLGLGDLREQTMQATVALSDSVVSILSKARTFDAKLPQAEVEFRNISERVKGVVEVLQKGAK